MRLRCVSWAPKGVSRDWWAGPTVSVVRPWGLRTVLIVSQELDPTADEVVLALGERGVPVFRIDRAWFPQRLTLEAELRDGRWAGCLRTGQRRVELDDIRSVWHRWRSTFVLSSQLSRQDQQHAEREARAGFDGVICSLDARHVNHPHRVAALPKPRELVLAARCGLDVPATVISNSSHQVRAFANGFHAVVRKLFSCHVLDEAGRSMVGIPGSSPSVNSPIWITSY